MTQQNFYANYLQVLQAIEHCENNNLLTPALVLLYSSIDSVSWLATSSTKESGKAFKTWVTDWMLKTPTIKCTADELYAARCGLVHTLTPTSSQTQKGTRKIAYSWGTASNEQLEELIQRTGSNQKLVSVHLSELIQAFRIGMADYLNYVSEDPLRMEAFEEKCKEHFATLSIDRVDQAVNLMGQLDRK
ncbi:hypothetical protein DP090_010385 [Pseudomonas sp. MDMC216]|nr:MULTISPECIES: hypothetical protein [Pseudomonas]MBA4682522.1 hypothetical protein [Pseudomonas sp.]MDH1561520.1 hypothetical protein [Pseudomonas chengduensis]MDI5993435.1 hypothetical protein [Pseudomonas sp. MDMC216]MDI6009177.1 hypothetical protein [Pseudomonas sp. MDMC17]MDZ4190565.1 hypothetical protein [Pseudomonas sp.]